MGDKVFFRPCSETEKILKEVPKGKKSDYIRKAIIFYSKHGQVMERIEQKLDNLLESKLVPAGNTGNTGREDVEDYLFSGMEEIL
ncbi:MAG: hypothetical protein H0Z35_07865 [Thermoanaerobacteraceae bacterium]|nr:hypothetical protein [Thermoanaerobacteraceae bacterium]